MTTPPPTCTSGGYMDGPVEVTNADMSIVKHMVTAAPTEFLEDHH